MLRLFLSAVVLVVTLTSTSVAVAQDNTSALNDGVRAILQQAATQDNGQHLDTVARMAIAAYPDAKDAILAEVATLTAAPAQAQDTPPATPQAVAAAPTRPAPAKAPAFWRFKSWDGDLDVNANYTSGNTDEKSFGSAIRMKNDRVDWHHRLTAFFDISENNGTKDKEKFGIGYKTDYDLSDRSFLSGQATYDYDSFGPFDERFTLSSGYGYRVIISDEFQWDVQAGPSVMFTKDTGENDYNQDMNAQASSIFNWVIAHNTSFNNEVDVFFGGRNVIDTKSSLRVQINGSLHSKLSFDLLYDKDAPADRKKTDSVTRLGIGYNF